jgi:hypothetical protein
MKLDRKFKSYDRESEEVTLTGPLGQEETFALGVGMELVVHNGPDKIEVLEEGDPVHITFEEQGDDKILTSLTAMHAPARYKPRLKRLKEKRK